MGELKPAGEAFFAVLEGLSMSYRRVRLAQQFPHWARTLHQSAVLMHGGLAREYPTQIGRSDAASLR